MKLFLFSFFFGNTRFKLRASALVRKVFYHLSCSLALIKPFQRMTDLQFQIREGGSTGKMIREEVELAQRGDNAAT
jgi:hypothetical protein